MSMVVQCLKQFDSQIDGGLMKVRLALFVIALYLGVVNIAVPFGTVVFKEIGRRIKLRQEV